VLVQLLVEVFPDLLVVRMTTGEEMIYCFISLPAGQACSHLRGSGGLVAVIEWKPLVNKLTDDSPFRLG